MKQRARALDSPSRYSILRLPLPSKEYEMANRSNQPQWGKATFTIEPAKLPACSITIPGRDRWALECLMAAGDAGCTPIDTPGPRWSGYVHILRQLGVVIDTVTEPHAGPFKGTHARYVLRCAVGRVKKSGVAA